MQILSKKFISIIFLLILFISTSLAEAVNVENIATFLGNNRWKWTIFIAEEESILNQIEYVEYTLHPTFPNPQQRIYEPNTNFSYTAIGWDTFTIRGKVFYKNNRFEEFEHTLVFNKRKAPPDMNITTQNWSHEIEPGWWEWGVSVIADEHILNQISCVVYTLHKSFPNPVRIICNRENNFELKTRGWGTFQIPIKILFKDGSVMELSHDLKFRE
ncbi:MAG: hypothetical protein P8078_05665 [bacterium]